MFEVRKIVTDKEKSLRMASTEVAKPYSSQDINDCLYLHEHLVIASTKDGQEKYGINPGVGLAAPQIGINKRMIGIYIEEFDEEGKVTSRTEYALINPKIISHSIRMAYLLSGEGCLSVKEAHEGYVPRFANITVTGYDCLTKQDVTLKLRGYHAIVFQHEIDHLDGIIYYDRIDKQNPFKTIDGALEI